MEKKNIKTVVITFAIMFAVIFLFRSFRSVGFGEAGVYFKTFGGGVVTDEPPKGEGLRFVLPWDDLYIYNVKQQEVFESKMKVLSSNGLDILLDLSLIHI